MSIDLSVFLRIFSNFYVLFAYASVLYHSKIIDKMIPCKPFPLGANAAGLLSSPDNCKTPPPTDAGNGVLAFPR